MTNFDTKNLKSWVILSANEVISKFGIRTAYGWRASDPFPDHPSGLAVDFMISDLPNGRAIGDQVAAYFVANGKRLGIKYIIWYRRSYNVQRGTWAPYTSSPNPHTDHVHATWNNAAPSGIGFTIPVADTTTQPAAFSQQLDQLNKIVDWINDRKNWLRLGFIFAGVGLIILGFIKFEFFTNAATKAVNNTTGKIVGAIRNGGQ